MEKDLKNKLHSMLTRIMSNIGIVEESDKENEEAKKPSKFINQEGINFENNSYNDFLELKEKLYTDDQIYRNYTLKEIDIKLVSLLIEQEKTSESILNSILDINNKKTEYEYYIPIYGVQITEKTEFKNITFIDKNEMLSITSKKHKNNIVLENLNEVYAHTKIKTASKKRGYELARKKIDRLLHILNFFVNPLTDKINMSTNNDISFFSNAIITNGEEITKSSTLEGQVIPIDLTKYKRIEDPTFDKLLNLFGSEGKKSNIEKRVLQGISWLGKSYLQKEYQYKFVQVITSIEALIQTEGSNTTKNMAEITALILKDNYSERLKMFKLFKHLYNIRSRIIHGEHTEIQYTELKDAYSIANSLLVYLLKKAGEITNINELNEYIEKLKFS